MNFVDELLHVTSSICWCTNYCRGYSREDSTHHLAKHRPRRCVNGMWDYNPGPDGYPFPLLIPPGEREDYDYRRYPSYVHRCANHARANNDRYVRYVRGYVELENGDWMPANEYIASKRV